ncbi:ATP-grasp domain-containing protein [Virgibacillus flavescens]|uniref:ATP-grasp domain-containing protein n=1 Tax=Virgibacillus flavescens TaxID=1611422 RepID=UPI003D3528BE
MNYKGWLLYSEKDTIDNANYINWFICEAKEQNIELELVTRENITAGIMSNNRTILVNNNPVIMPDFVVMRTIDTMLSLHLEAMGIRVFNSSVVSHFCNNKELTHHYVHNLKIPMVDTLFIHQEQLQTFNLMKYPFVAKVATSRGGKEVYLIENHTDWNNCLRLLPTNPVILQSCDVSFGKDLRVFVVGNEIVGSVLRENPNDFRANYKLGGSASWYTLNEEERDTVNKIINEFQFDMVGIDFLFSESGKLLFNEIEDVVGSRTLSAVSDINILQKYITHIKSKLQ